MSILAKFNALTSARNATADALDLIDELREQGVDLKAEIARLHAAPQPVADAMACYDAWAQTVATAAIDNLRPGNLLHPHTSAEGLRLPLVTQQVGDHPIRDHGASIGILLGLVIATSMPALRKIIEGQLEDFTTGIETLSPATRAKRIVAAEGRLLAVEFQEEAAIRAMENAGIAVERRADADPRAVLASDASLPT